MSAHPFWSLNFDLRPDLPPHVLDVLAAVARDTEPDAAQLALLHPVVRYYLADWRRMLDEEMEPFAGTPIRLFRPWTYTGGPELAMSIEFGFHDDAYANGAYLFELWLFSLAFRPPPRPGPSMAVVIGHWRLYERDNDPGHPIFVRDGGIDTGGDASPLSFEELDSFLDEQHASDWDVEPYNQ